MCECIETIEKAMNEDADADKKDAVLESAFVLNGDVLTRALFVHAKARVKKRDGSFTKNKHDIQIFFTYCPFCGKKLEKEK